MRKKDIGMAKIEKIYVKLKHTVFYLFKPTLYEVKCKFKDMLKRITRLMQKKPRRIYRF